MCRKSLERVWNGRLLNCVFPEKDECALGGTAACGLGTCEDQVGGYDCFCPAGTNKMGTAAEPTCVEGGCATVPDEPFRPSLNHFVNNVNRCCFAVDQCSSSLNPCLNSAVCSNGTSNATCACPSGFYGSKCQHGECTAAPRCKQPQKICERGVHRCTGLENIQQVEFKNQARLDSKTAEFSLTLQGHCRARERGVIL